jgi:hypothetical protein
MKERDLSGYCRPKSAALVWSLNRRSVMSGNILNSDGIHVGVVHGPNIFDLSGKKLYTLKGVNIYRLSGELVGHLSDARGSEKRLTPRLRRRAEGPNFARIRETGDDLHSSTGNRVLLGGLRLRHSVLAGALFVVNDLISGGPISAAWVFAVLGAVCWIWGRLMKFILADI